MSSTVISRYSVRLCMMQEPGPNALSESPARRGIRSYCRVLGRDMVWLFVLCVFFDDA